MNSYNLLYVPRQEFTWLLKMNVLFVCFAISTFGNPLVTSSFIGENLFAVGLTLLSIGLFAQLIGSMMVSYLNKTNEISNWRYVVDLTVAKHNPPQIYMRSLSTNAEDWRIQKTEMEDWMTDQQIPDDLRNRIRHFLEYKWISTQGVEEDLILRQLPVDLHRDIKLYLCLDLVQRVSAFMFMLMF